MDALNKVIDIFSGNKSALAKRLAERSGNEKLVSVHITNWIERDKKVPAEYVIPLADICDYAVTPHELRPDLYPLPHDCVPLHLRGVA